MQRSNKLKPPDRVHCFTFLVEVIEEDYHTAYPFEHVKNAASYFRARSANFASCDVNLYLVNSFNSERFCLGSYRADALGKRLLHESKLLHLLLREIHMAMRFEPGPVKFTDEYPSHLGGKMASFETVGEKYPPLLTVQCEPVKDHLVVSTYSTRPTKPYVSGRLYTKEEAKAKAVELLEADKAGADFHVAKIVADVVQKKTEEITYKLVDR